MNNYKRLWQGLTGSATWFICSKHSDSKFCLPRVRSLLTFWTTVRGKFQVHICRASEVYSLNIIIIRLRKSWEEKSVVIKIVNFCGQHVLLQDRLPLTIATNREFWTDDEDEKLYESRYICPNDVEQGYHEWRSFHTNKDRTRTCLTKRRTLFDALLTLLFNIMLVDVTKLFN